MQAAADLREQLRVRLALAQASATASLRAYLDEVVIDCCPSPRRFGMVADPWQWEMLGPIIPAVESVAGLRSGYSGPISFWRTLPRGHDKTGAIGRMLNWALATSKRPLEIATAAADGDQAELITRSMWKEAALNPWLSQRLHFTRKEITGPGGRLSVLTSDAASNSGLLCDLIICDELTWWKNRDLWDILWSGREKRPGSVVIVITNAGETGSWQHGLQKAAGLDPTWDVWEAPRPLASWMTAEGRERMRKLLPPGLARRVLDNIWIDPGEAGYLSQVEVLACEALGRELGLCRQLQGLAGLRYVAGIDYGPKRDRTALCVLHRTPSGKIALDRLDVFQGSPDAPVPIAWVEEWITEVNRGFFKPLLVFDPYQMEALAQKYELSQEVVRHEARGGKANYEMAENLRSLVANRQLAWYPDAGVCHTDIGPDLLAAEFARLIVKVQPYGYRFDHPHGFHDDRVVSIGMAALALCRMDPSSPGVPPPPLPRKPQPKPFSTDRRDRAQERGLYGAGR